jgi:AmmeMemoRadiSam system protein B
MATTRRPAVAGSFYPTDPGELEHLISELLSGPRGPASRPKALIVPHAGYRYSGPVAASAYRWIAPLPGVRTRVVLVGPSHRVPLQGFAVPEADRFRTPLGDVPVDDELVQIALRHPASVHSDEPHRFEHSLEVQLPFLQVQLREFSLLPVAFGQVRAEDLARLMDDLWGAPETIVIVSSDLSHYHDYETARRLDTATAEAILALEPDRLREGMACGLAAIEALLALARDRRLRVSQLDLANSGDTSGSRDEVVGYGAFAFWPADVPLAPLIEN